MDSQDGSDRRCWRWSLYWRLAPIADSAADVRLRQVDSRRRQHFRGRRPLRRSARRRAQRQSRRRRSEQIGWEARARAGLHSPRRRKALECRLWQLFLRRHWQRLLRRRRAAAGRIAWRDRAIVTKQLGAVNVVHRATERASHARPRLCAIHARVERACNRRRAAAREAASAWRRQADERNGVGHGRAGTWRRWEAFKRPASSSRKAARAVRPLCIAHAEQHHRAVGSGER